MTNDAGGRLVERIRLVGGLLQRLEKRAKCRRLLVWMSCRTCGSSTVAKKRCACKCRGAASRGQAVNDALISQAHIAYR